MSINSQSIELLKLMSDGEYHSGEALGQSLGISRAGIWKILESLSPYGLEIERVRGKGYCVRGGVDFLDEFSIRQRMAGESLALCSGLHIEQETASTNQVLLDRINSGNPCENASVVFAEMQSAGRGRRGRIWQSPFAQNIYMSFAWRFESGIAAMEGLSLAVGLGVVKALNALGFEQASLKWPNDILSGDAKLGGVLIEIAGDVGGQCYAVIGVGLNVGMHEGAMQGVGQPWTSLQKLSGQNVSRNVVAAAILDALIPMVGSFESIGFSRYRSDWEGCCPHIGKRVLLETPSGAVHGVMLGVDDTGSLVMSVDGVEQIFVGGEISLRVDDGESEQ